MRKLDDKKDIDQGLPTVEGIINKTAKDISKQIDSFLKSMTEGFEKFIKP